MSVGESSASIERVRVMDDDGGDGHEDSPLIAEDSFSQQSTGSSVKVGSSGYGMPGRKYSRKRSINAVENGGSNSWMAILSFSTTTGVGLLLLMAMVTLTILSVCLQRYSTNTYVDIIVPPHNISNATNASSIDIAPGSAVIL